VRHEQCTGASVVTAVSLRDRRSRPTDAVALLGISVPLSKYAVGRRDAHSLHADSFNTAIVQSGAVSIGSAINRCRARITGAVVEIGCEIKRPEYGALTRCFIKAVAVATRRTMALAHFRFFIQLTINAIDFAINLFRARITGAVVEIGCEIERPEYGA
jgi:hypothetical protein